MPHSFIKTFNLYQTLADGQSIFKGINLTIKARKTAIIGRNGIGKSTLLKLFAKKIEPSNGCVIINGMTTYLAQNASLVDDVTVSSILGMEAPLQAMQNILQGSTNLTDFEILADRWDIQQLFRQRLALFHLDYLLPMTQIKNLSGGEKTRLLLTQIFSDSSDIILLDEPSNHLDSEGKKILFDCIKQSTQQIIIVSHDRDLLQLMEEILEISSLGVSVFGGNYEFYRAQKSIHDNAKIQQYKEAKTHLLRVERSVQCTKEKHEQRTKQGERLRQRGDQPKILLDAKKDRSTAAKKHMTIKHDKMVSVAKNNLLTVKGQLNQEKYLHVTMPGTNVSVDKIVISAQGISFSYPNSEASIINNFYLTIKGPEKIALCGKNGSGKTTLVRLLLGELRPDKGQISRGTRKIHYLDQNLSLLDPNLSIYQNYINLNENASHHTVHEVLAQFLFKDAAVNRLVRTLSEGEKLRVSLACILKSITAPQLLILDEPTNHLDLASVQVIESLLKQYQGALIIISHDHSFMHSLGVRRIIKAPFTDHV